jgi:hypothetical protein
LKNRTAQTTYPAAVILAATLLLTACGGNGNEDTTRDSGGDVTYSQPASESSTTVPTSTTPTPVDPADADGRTRATLTEFFSWNPTDDVSPADAVERTSGNFTNRWVKDTRPRWSGLTATTSKQWGAWKNQGARQATVGLREHTDERPGDAPDKIYRAYTVTQTFADRNGTFITRNTFTVFTTSVREDNTWKIDELKIEG